MRCWIGLAANWRSQAWHFHFGLRLGIGIVRFLLTGVPRQFGQCIGVTSLRMSANRCAILPPLPMHDYPILLLGLSWGLGHFHVNQISSVRDTTSIVAK